METYKGLSPSSLEGYALELSRMKALRMEHVGIFVQRERELIVEVWERGQMGDDERALSSDLFSDGPSFSISSTNRKADEEVVTGSRRLFGRTVGEARTGEGQAGGRTDRPSACPRPDRTLRRPPPRTTRSRGASLSNGKVPLTLADLDGSLGTRQVAEKDPDRYKKGSRGDPGKLLREEKIRKRIKKDMPKVRPPSSVEIEHAAADGSALLGLGQIEADLQQIVPQWELERGKPFTVHDVRFLDAFMAKLEARDASHPVRSPSPLISQKTDPTTQRNRARSNTTTGGTTPSRPLKRAANPTPGPSASRPASPVKRPRTALSSRSDAAPTTVSRNTTGASSVLSSSSRPQNGAITASATGTGGRKLAPPTTASKLASQRTGQSTTGGGIRGGPTLYPQSTGGSSTFSHHPATTTAATTTTMMRNGTVGVGMPYYHPVTPTPNWTSHPPPSHLLLAPQSTVSRPTGHPTTVNKRPPNAQKGASVTDERLFSPENHQQGGANGQGQKQRGTFRPRLSAVAGMGLGLGGVGVGTGYGPVVEDDE